MLVKFSSPVAADIIMFGDVAKRLLELMGASGKIPSAAQPEELRWMKDRLVATLEQVEPAVEPPREEDTSGDRIERPVPLATRAYPLLEMIDAALAAEKHVSWDKA